MTPDVTLQRLRTSNGHLYVVRDDLLFGGSKERAAVPFLERKKLEGSREVVYASPFCGFAQVALAAAAKHVGLRATLFCEKDPRPGAESPLHEFSRLGASLGARVVPCDSLAIADWESRLHERRVADCYRVPLGFDCPEFRGELRRALSACWEKIRESADRVPHTVWVCVGSGTLARTLREVLPAEVQLRGIDVGVLPESDDRLRALRETPGMGIARSPEAFHDSVQQEPPLPSNRHYDAKVWRFLRASAANGDVWWNIAR